MASHSKAAILAAILLAAAAFPIAGCDKGLAPIYEESGFEGVIHYVNWPPATEVRELRLLAFDFVPRDSSRLADIFVSALTDPGHVVLYPPLGTPGLRKNVDTIHYKLTTPGSTLLLKEYKYIVLAQRYGPNSFTDWKPAGIYTHDPATLAPASVFVRPRRLVQGVDIYVDFTKPPPKPWQ